MRSFPKKAFVIFTLVLFFFNCLHIPSSFAKPKSLKAVPKKTIISVDQVPENLVSLVVPLTFDTNVINISSASSTVDGALIVFGQNGVGIVQTSGNLPSMFNVTVNFKAIQRGKTDISVGEIVDKIDGTLIEGAFAKSSAKKIKVK